MQRQRLAGEIWRGNGLLVISETEAISFGAGSMRAIYRRPTALIVRQEDGAERLAVPDVTRLGQLSLVAMAAIFAIVAWLVGRPGRTS